jgi:hypothetical protein
MLSSIFKFQSIIPTKKSIFTRKHKSLPTRNRSKINSSRKKKKLMPSFKNKTSSMYNKLRYPPILSKYHEKDSELLYKSPYTKFHEENSELLYKPPHTSPFLMEKETFRDNIFYTPSKYIKNCIIGHIGRGRDVILPNDFEKIYISIGSQVRRDVVTNPETNITEQLIPALIRSNEGINDEKILIIAIDSFESNLQYNETRVSEIMNRFNEHKQITFIFINDFLDESVAELLSKIIRNNTMTSDCIVCNYVRFASERPTPIEKTAEKNVHDICILYFSAYYYMWCGYQTFFTKLILKYNPEKMADKTTIDKCTTFMDIGIRRFTQTLFVYDDNNRKQKFFSITSQNTEDFIKYNNSNTNLIKAIRTFFNNNNLYDITQTLENPSKYDSSKLLQNVSDYISPLY